MLTRVGIELAGADRIEILVEAGNEPSATIAAAARLSRGGRSAAPAPAARRRARRDALVFTLLAEELAGSPAAGVGFAAFDCRGLPIA